MDICKEHKNLKEKSNRKFFLPTLFFYRILLHNYGHILKSSHFFKFINENLLLHLAEVFSTVFFLKEAIFCLRVIEYWTHGNQETSGLWSKPNVKTFQFNFVFLFNSILYFFWIQFCISSTIISIYWFGKNIDISTVLPNLKMLLHELLV